ncbi:aminodeoxychorismate lyase [Shewanella sp. 3B26]|uniref:Aminodeoxychorismate lyase n=1 Tax=Shewanella zhuhaiensis TaxID=2919576 RepID=A0AAJ1BG25_9GAMM|nr:aminodeoxychorismate lyase [Shewanella zhuhaiensis]MCH4294113.1 aminodeoxychorismate lyase [Shewanella zhuhaiensis]
MATVTMEGGKGKAIASLCWLDLTLEPAHSEQAHNISPMDRGLAYGDGLFATMALSREGKVAFLESHLSRLKQGASRLGFALDIKDIEARLIVAAKSQTKYKTPRGLKLLISRGAGGRGYLAPDDPSPVAVLSAFDIPAHYLDWQQQGIALASSELMLGHQPKLAGIKHLNRLEQVLIRRQVLPEWAQDFLVCDALGQLVEASMANLLFIKGKQCITPSLAYSGVSGVMRQQVIMALLTLGYSVEMKPLHRAELAQFEAVLMTNSLLGIVDVIRIDNSHYKAFNGTNKVRKALELTL